MQFQSLMETERNKEVMTLLFLNLQFPLGSKWGLSTFTIDIPFFVRTFTLKEAFVRMGMLFASLMFRNKGFLSQTQE